MWQLNSSIFRPDAIRNYVESKEKSVLPRLVSPRSFIFLWVLLSLTVVAGLLLGLAKVPAYSKAVIVVVKENGRREDGRVQMILWLPPEVLPRLKVGQKVFFRLQQDGDVKSRAISTVEPHISTTAELQKRFALGSEVSTNPVGPVAVAWLEAEPVSADLTNDRYVGGFYNARVEMGSERVLTVFSRSLGSSVAR